jgi:hypothetical protein
MSLTSPFLILSFSTVITPKAVKPGILTSFNSQKNMKHYSILLTLLLFTTIIKAQDEKRNKGLSRGIEFRYLSTTNVQIGSEKMDNLSGTYGKSIRFKLGYFLNPHIYTGVSIGADRYEVAAANTFPLTVNLHYYLKDSKNNPLCI